MSLKNQFYNLSNIVLNRTVKSQILTICKRTQLSEKKILQNYVHVNVILEELKVVQVAKIITELFVHHCKN